MKNLTNSQKIIIDSLIDEFEKLNPKTSSSSDSLFDISKIKADFIDKEKRHLELKKTNEAFLNLRKEMVLSDYATLKPEMDKLNIPINIVSNNDGYIRINIGTGSFGYSENNIALNYCLESVRNSEFGDSLYTEVVRTCYVYGGDKSIKFSTLKEFCDEISKKALLKVYSHFAKKTEIE